ncbi:hypothetical protein SUGI_0004960 [Cryptomeria japonica]|nr:hypothetical protein SUGI_0004960 [Cryptomeria japonica]
MESRVSRVPGVGLLGILVGMSMSVSVIMAWAAVPDCFTATREMVPCLGYLMTGNPPPQIGSPCCKGVQTLHGQVNNHVDMQSICQCMKIDANIYHFNDAALSTLMPSCSVFLPFNLTKYMDCSKVPQEWKTSSKIPPV